MTEKVEGVFWERSDQLLENGFHIKFITMSSNSPLHWHKSMEVLFILNGRATVNLDGVKHKLNPLDMIVVIPPRFMTESLLCPRQWAFAFTYPKTL